MLRGELGVKRGSGSVLSGELDVKRGSELVLRGKWMSRGGVGQCWNVEWVCYKCGVLLCTCL